MAQSRRKGVANMALCLARGLVTLGRLACCSSLLAGGASRDLRPGLLASRSREVWPETFFWRRAFFPPLKSQISSLIYQRLRTVKAPVWEASLPLKYDHREWPNVKQCSSEKEFTLHAQKSQTLLVLYQSARGRPQGQPTFSGSCNSHS